MLSGERTADRLQLANISPWVPRMGFLRSPLPRRQTERALSVFHCSFWQTAVDSCVSISVVSGADSLTHQAAQHRAASSGAKKKNLPSVLFGTLQGKICAASLYGAVAHHRRNHHHPQKWRDVSRSQIQRCFPRKYRIFRTDTNIREENGRMHQPISLSSICRSWPGSPIMPHWTAG